MGESKRHHYIPQFILRNFLDKNGQLSYWDLEKKKLEKRNPKSIFMNFDMYRDEINHQDDPTLIESSLAVFEREISELINKKLLSEKEVVLTRAELESLRIFLSLLSFRSDLRMNQYKNANFNESTKKILEEYAHGNFEDLWKREIEILSKCRSYDEIRKNAEIDPIIKLDFENDLRGYYMTLVDARGEDFILTDVYPTLEVFPVNQGVNLHLHALYPISNKRLLLINHIMFRPDAISNPLFDGLRRISQIKGTMIIPPKNRYSVSPYVHTSSDQYIYKVGKIYSNDVEYINALQLNEARVGIMFSDAENIVSSIEAFNRRNDTKQVYLELENALCES